MNKKKGRNERRKIYFKKRNKKVCERKRKDKDSHTII